MDKEKKNRSGSQSNRGSNEGSGNRGRDQLPGAPAKSNRQTKGRDHAGPEKETGEKKQSNSI